MTKIFTQVLLFFIESFTLNEIWELEKNSLATAAFKKGTNILSTEFREDILENIRTSVIVRTSLRSVRTSKPRSEYFPVWTSQLVNKSIFLVLRVLRTPESDCHDHYCIAKFTFTSHYLDIKWAYSTRLIQLPRTFVPVDLYCFEPILKHSNVVWSIVCAVFNRQLDKKLAYTLKCRLISFRYKSFPKNN